MKEEKGITLLTLILYIMGLTLILSMLGTISTLFFSNTKHVTENSKSIAEFNKFNMYWIEDIKKCKEVEVTKNQVLLKDDTEGNITYTYKSEPDYSIYRNKVKICNNITYCSFSKTDKKEDKLTKQIITVHMLIKGSKLWETTNDYVLKYW